MTAKEILRAFEDRLFGADAPRYAGDLERGHGSKFQEMSPEARAEHAALEKLVETEAALEKAIAAVAKAEEKHAEAAVAHARVAPKPADPEVTGTEGGEDGYE